MHRILVAAETGKPVLDEIGEGGLRLSPRDRQIEAVQAAGMFGKFARDHGDDFLGDGIGLETRHGLVQWRTVLAEGSAVIGIEVPGAT